MVIMPPPVVSTTGARSEVGPPTPPSIEGAAEVRSSDIKRLLGHPSAASIQGLDVAYRGPPPLAAALGLVPVRVVAMAGELRRKEGLGAPTFGVAQTLAAATPARQRGDAVACPFGVRGTPTAVDTAAGRRRELIVISPAETSCRCRRQRRRLGPRTSPRHLEAWRSTTKASATKTWGQDSDNGR